MHLPTGKAHRSEPPVLQVPQLVLQPALVPLSVQFFYLGLRPEQLLVAPPSGPSLQNVRRRWTRPPF